MSTDTDVEGVPYDDGCVAEPPPAGCRTATVTGAGGVRLRVLHAPADPACAPRGTVAILPGRTQFAERWFETMRELAARGFATAVVDHRGQGGSPRPLDDPMRHHLTDFGVMVADAARFVRRLATCGGMPEPLWLLGHSMGAHVGLRLLAESKEAASIRAAVLTAPMVAIRTAPLPRRPAEALARLMVRLGRGGNYAFGQGPWRDDARDRAMRRRLLSESGTRLALERAWLARRPDLAVGGVTWEWVAAALASSRRLQAPGAAESVATPCLFVLAGRDRVVDNRAARRLVRRMPQARLVEIPDALHEILHERDEVRAAFWRAFDDFVAGRA